MVALSHLDVLILAGGRSTRMGRDKSILAIGAESLVERTVSAATSELSPDRVIVISATPEQPLAGVSYVREDPPFAGPVAAIAAALDLLTAEWALLLPCDLATPGAAVECLRSQWETTQTTLIARDAHERAQWLTGIVNVADLRRAVAALESTDVPVRAIFAEVAHEFCDAPDANPQIWDDMDTPEDFDRISKES